MFYLEKDSARLQHALKEHYVNCRYVIKRRLLGDTFTERCPSLHKIQTKKVKVDTTVFNFLNNEDNLKLILCGTPEHLDKIKNELKKYKGDLNKILNYGYFNCKGQYKSKTVKEDLVNRYNSYHLASNLGFNTCVYCNRNYTNTITSGVRINKFKNKRISPKLLIARPTLDHWFPQAHYPILALSFFNLIPACSVCNSSVKGQARLSLSDHFHPYYKSDKIDKQMQYRFDFDLLDSEKAKVIIQTGNDFSKKSINEYKIEEMYSSHDDELRNLIMLKKHFGTSYLTNLSSILEDSNITTRQMQNLIFGRVASDEEMVKSPLSKFKADILEKLNVLPRK